MKNHRIAIIGSGMAGLTAARRLAEAGLTVTVFDKGRGPGGRMATRRIDGAQFDHGVVRMTAEGAGFRAVLEAAVAGGSAAPWADGIVGVPAMKTPFTQLPDGVTLHQSVRIVSLGKQGGWTLNAEDGTAHGPYDAVLVTIPPVQAAELYPPVADALALVRMAPQWAAMLAWSAALDVPGDLLKPGGPLDSVQVMGTKPGRKVNGTALVVHATPDWTRDNLDLEKPVAAGSLLDLARDALDADLPEPDYLSGHRWLYSRCEVPLGAPFASPEQGLWFGGDWALGDLVEHAFLSGRAMAEAALEALSETRQTG